MSRHAPAPRIQSLPSQKDNETNELSVMRECWTGALWAARTVNGARVSGLGGEADRGAKAGVGGGSNMLTRGILWRVVERKMASILGQISEAI